MADSAVCDSNCDCGVLASTPAKLPVIDLSALSWHCQVEEFYLHTFLIPLWFPDCPTANVLVRGLYKGVRQEVNQKIWHFSQFWLAA